MLNIKCKNVLESDYEVWMSINIILLGWRRERECKVFVSDSKEKGK